MFGSKTRTLLKTGKADSHGNLAVSYRAPHSTTFTVVFAGDAKYAPKTVTQVVYVRARASLAISGNYAIKRIGSYTYRLYTAAPTSTWLAAWRRTSTASASRSRRRSTTRARGTPTC